MEDILTFWFEEAGPDKWFVKDPEFDRKIGRRFSGRHETAARRGYDAWRETALGSLALCLLLDQFPRNMYRGKARAFATDAMALEVARSAVDRGLDRSPGLGDRHRLFLYLPFEHSENMDDQRQSVSLARRRLKDPSYIDYARRHFAVIERFGRFPHRNQILGRQSSAGELAYLAETGSGF